jgi:FtsP/CotA-like multicopper oxidase with cupredoxin domain
VGTEVRATIRNNVGVAVFVHGLFDRSVEPLSEAPPPVLIRPGKTSEVRFRADAPGSFSYWASTNITAEVGGDRGHDNMMQGALVIDEPGPTPPDRVFVIGIWGEARSRTDPEAGGRETLVVNGKSWPHTERMVHTVGDTIRWRWINASERGHPMHLHGYFFRVDGKGDFVASETFGPELRRQAVTEQLEPGESMYVTWSPPDHPGNWIFHCHLSYHVNGALRLTPVADGEHAPHMAGLALGIEVRPDPDEPDAYRWSTERTLQLHVETIEDQWGEMDGLAFRLAGDRVEPLESATIPGPPLVLTRGEATAVQVINHLDEPTSIHWHGLELESYSDGVPDWSGTAGRIAHPVEPGDTFEAHLTLKRSGTFIYHSHLRDIRQLSRGMYGAILVFEPGEEYDPATDHLFVLGWGGGDAPPTWELNGSSDPAGREIEVGVSQRLRFVNIAPAAPRELRLRDPEGQLMQWRRVAEDGAVVGAARAHPVPAVGEVDVGETLDVRFTPDRPGTYVLEVPRWPGQPPFRVSLTAR